MRQTPFTARLSPGDELAARAPCAIRRRTPPLRRLALDQLADRFNEAREHIPQSARRAERLDAPLDQRRRRERAGRRAAARRAAPSTCGVTYSRTKSTSPSSHAARVQRRAAFEQQRSDAARAEPRQRRAEASPSAATRSRAPRCFERAPRSARAAAAAVVTMMTGPASSCREHARGRRRPQPPIEDHPRQWPFAIRAARGQQRIVDQNRPDADADRVDFGADALRVAVGGGRRQRRPLAGRCRNPAVDAGRRLQDDERRPSRISVKNG